MRSEGGQEWPVAMYRSALAVLCESKALSLLRLTVVGRDVVRGPRQVDHVVSRRASHTHCGDNRWLSLDADGSPTWRRGAVSPHRRAVVSGVRCELTSASRALIRFLKAAGYQGLQGFDSAIRWRPAGAPFSHPVLLVMGDATRCRSSPHPKAAYRIRLSR